MTFASGPFDIQQGNTANFSVEFLSSTNTLTTPSTTNMTISYVNLSSTNQTDTITLTQTGSFYTGTWSSTSADLGLATWAVTATGSTTTQATGQLRIIQRQSTW